MVGYKDHTPNLQYFAQKYLPLPVGEGDVERIFSKTGMIYCPRRNKLLSVNCKMVVVTNSALHSFQFLLDGDVKLQVPDFIVHERDLTNAVDVEYSDDEEL